ncbi:MAG: alkaline phosphatase [Planctomycetes bacterium]|nr:alkaline phosphatase [Planctomycetota bacterium]MBI3847248.1 alkaline phosphatase [Planctomycetota bacterium]
MRHRPFALLLSVVALVACVAVAPSGAGAPQASAERPHAVIFMIGDGFGISQLAFSRNVVVGKGKRFVLESLPVVGLMTTWSASNAVTDSGAAATAMGAGVKTDNKHIGMDAAGKPVSTFADRAKEQGWKLGYVTTTRITHATPAACYGHVINRDDEWTIAEQILVQRPDVALGGGAAFFLPAAKQGKRTDGRDLLEEARKLGYAVWQRGDAWTSPPPDRLLGVFANDHLAYKLDDARLPPERRDPPLDKLTSLALDVLTKRTDGAKDDRGFYLMIEGGRIDHACHEHDAAGCAAEAADFDRAVAVVLEFQKKHPDTLVVLTADHATGGLAMNDTVDWDAVKRQKCSLLWLSGQVRSGGAGAALINEMTGYTDFGDEDVKVVRDAVDDYQGARELGHRLGRRQGVTWVPRINFQDTFGHTGEDVAVFAGGPGSSHFAGEIDNTDIPRLFCKLLGWHDPN